MAQTRAPKAAVAAVTGMLTLSTALVLAGCGGSSPSHSSTLASAGAASAQVQTAAGGQSSVSGSSSGSGSGSGSSTGSAAAGSQSSGSGSKRTSGAKQHLRAVDVISKPSAHKARGGPDEPVTPAIKAPNPCLLVSHTEATSILGGPVVQTEAPLGPTCIMKVGAHKQVVTLSVGAVSVKTQVRNMRQLQTATVGGHQTYCGKLGQPQLYLNLGGGKAIAVSAPCTVARALAASALSRLTA
jgi:hypothetical protein